MSEYETSDDEDIVRGKDLDAIDSKKDKLLTGPSFSNTIRDDPLLYRKNVAVTVAHFIKKMKHEDN